MLAVAEEEEVGKSFTTIGGGGVRRAGGRGDSRESYQYPNLIKVGVGAGWMGGYMHHSKAVPRLLTVSLSLFCLDASQLNRK